MVARMRGGTKTRKRRVYPQQFNKTACQVGHIKCKYESTIVKSDSIRTETSLFKCTKHANDWHVY